MSTGKKLVEAMARARAHERQEAQMLRRVKAGARRSMDRQNGSK